MPRIVDVHSHIVPQVYLDALAKHDAVLEDGFPPPVWSPDKQLEFMSALDVSWCLLALSSPHPYFGDPGESKELCRAINEEAAAFKRKYPDKIGFSAVLPLPDVDAAVEEAKYALDVLGANGIKLASNSRGQYIGAAEMEPLFHELNARGTVINIHPHRPTPQQEGIFTAGPVSLFEFLADTTRAVMNMIANGVLERYPDIKVIVPHNGSFLPNIYQRFQGLIAILAPKGLMPEVDVKGNIAKLYFDTSGHPCPHLLDLLMTITDQDHVMYGSDFPYTGIPEMTEVQNALKDKVNTSAIYDAEKLFYKNAATLFGL